MKVHINTFGGGGKYLLPESLQVNPETEDGQANRHLSLEQISPFWEAFLQRGGKRTGGNLPQVIKERKEKTKNKTQNPTQP